MMSAVNVTTNPETHRTSRHNVRQIMLVPREARDTHRSSNTIRGDLYRRPILVLVRDDGRDGPGLRAVSRRKRAAAVEEFTTLASIQRSRALRDALQDTFDDHAVDDGLRAQQSRFARAIILLLAAD